MDEASKFVVGLLLVALLCLLFWEQVAPLVFAIQDVVRTALGGF